jgi:hypothetical protein
MQSCTLTQLVVGMVCAEMILVEAATARASPVQLNWVHTNLFNPSKLQQGLHVQCHAKEAAAVIERYRSEWLSPEALLLSSFRCAVMGKTCKHIYALTANFDKMEGNINLGWLEAQGGAPTH